MELKFFFISKLFILKIYYKIILYFFNLHTYNNIYFFFK